MWITLTQLIQAAVSEAVRPFAERLNDNGRLLDGDEMATRLGVSRPTLDRLRAAGTVPSIKVGSRRLFDAEAVLKAMSEINVA